MKNNNYSKSPISGIKYRLPKGSDKQRIDDFLSQNQRKKVVLVQGLGFVGAVMSLVCSNALNDEYAVIGIDLPDESNFWKIASINNGIFPVVSSDPKIEEYFNTSKSKNNLIATYDHYAYSLADVIIVDINLDVSKNSDFNKNLINYSVNLDHFKKGIKTLGTFCKKDVLILVETTVPPGTCSKVVYPILYDCLLKRNLPTNEFKLGHSYERVMPGPNYIDSIQNFYRVYSGINDDSTIATEKFLKTIISTDKYPLTRLGNTNATEMAKVLENSYRAMNISFMVEWSRFAEHASVNLYEVINAIKMRPTHSNMMYPGIGVGGYCLTKDPLLASWSIQNLFDFGSSLNISEESVQINDKMPLYAFEFLKKSYKKSLKSKKILLLGVSYRSDISDTRYSPVEPFYNYLISNEADVYLHDPYVKYWEEKDLEIRVSLRDLLKKEYDIVIFCTNHSEYICNNFLIDSLSNAINQKLFIFDTVGVLNDDEIKVLNKNHIVKIVGRGDF